MFQIYLAPVGLGANLLLLWHTFSAASTYDQPTWTVLNAGDQLLISVTAGAAHYIGSGTELLLP